MTSTASARTTYPPALHPGSTIAVTALSAPVSSRHARRLDFVLEWLRRRGYTVVEGECLRAEGRVSAPWRARAAEFNAFVADPDVAAIIPPWGGETAIDVVDALDYDLFRESPTWVAGWSDISTHLLPLTLRTGVATAHGQNLMDLPYGLPEGEAHLLDVLALEGGSTFSQHDPRVRRRGGFDDWDLNPEASTMDLTERTAWRPFLRVPDDGLTVSGRLIGGCLDVLCNLAGTAYADVAEYGRQHSDDGLIVYLENCEANALDAARMLHGLRLAGWFEHARALLIGRTGARPSAQFTQDDAVRDALGRLDVPVIADVDFGHVPPSNVLVNGALADVVLRDGRHEITQRFV